MLHLCPAQPVGDPVVIAALNCKIPRRRSFRMRISAGEIAERALRRIEARGRGMLLLHDIKPATVLELPIILRELKSRGYRIVHVEPATVDRVKTATLPAQWLARNNGKS